MPAHAPDRLTLRHPGWSATRVRLVEGTDLIVKPADSSGFELASRWPDTEAWLTRNQLHPRQQTFARRVDLMRALIAADAYDPIPPRTVNAVTPAPVISRGEGRYVTADGGWEVTAVRDGKDRRWQLTPLKGPFAGHPQCRYVTLRAARIEIALHQGR